MLFLRVFQIAPLMKKIIVFPIILFSLFTIVSCVHECNCRVIEKTPFNADSLRIDTFYNVAMQTKGDCTELSDSVTYTISNTDVSGNTYHFEVGNITLCE